MIDTKKLLKGDRRVLAKAMTLVESYLEQDRIAAHLLLQTIMPHCGSSLRIGISGPPGVGKSTFINVLGMFLIKRGLKVAVLAVDPSSPISGGSLLGDKTRMFELSQNENAFIRPSPTWGNYGGVNNRSREMILVCEAAGHDVVLIETVGVGQSEYEVSNMVDYFLALMLPNAGDELQGIKKGILEVVDGIVVHKADSNATDQAELTKNQLLSAMNILGKGSAGNVDRVKKYSSLEDNDPSRVWDMIEKFIQAAKSSAHFKQKRADQLSLWLEKLVFENINLALKNFVQSTPKLMQSQKGLVSAPELIFDSADLLAKEFLGKK